MTTDIFFEVTYPTWVGKLLVVKKPGGDWRMCVNLTNFCPLPSIDQKVEALSGHPLLCFLDLYKGYQHVMMDPTSATKTAFITNQGVYA